MDKRVLGAESGPSAGGEDGRPVAAHAEHDLALALPDVSDRLVAGEWLTLGAPTQTICLDRPGGVIDGLNTKGLVTLAQSHRCVIQMVPAMGEFVPEHARVFEVFDATSTLDPRVQAIDRLQDLLGRVGRRPQPSGRYLDDRGDLRVVRPIVAWDALVTLAFEEIREYGHSSMQVHRRLRAAIEQLLEVVPAQRWPPFCANATCLS